MNEIKWMKVIVGLIENMLVMKEEVESEWGVWEWVKEGMKKLNNVK